MEEITDNEFYVVVWNNDDYNITSRAFIHVRNGESVLDYMQRVLHVDVEQIEQIYKRTFVKQ